jgi:uncharacterized protein DUF1707
VIPVLLMLVYPGPAYPGPAQPPGQRASDADRDIAADILCAAVGDGRLSLAELDQRAGAALSARTRAELAALVADLSGPRLAPPIRSPARAGGAGARWRGARRRRTRAAPAGPAPLASSRWAIIQSLIDRWASPVAADLS